MFKDDYGVDYPKEIVINSGVELGATSPRRKHSRSTAVYLGR